MKKIILLLVLILAAGAGVGSFAYSQRQAIVMGKIQKGLQALTGTEAVIEGVQLKNSQGFSRNVSLGIAKLRIKNLPGFNQPELAEISNVEIEVDFLKLLMGRWTILTLKVSIDRIHLEIDSKGKLSLAALASLQNEALERAGTSSFEVQRLEFLFGNVYFYDYRSVQNPQPEEYNFAGRLEVYTSVQHPEVLIQAPVLQLLYQLNKGSLGLPRDKIQEAVSRNTGKNRS